MSGGFIIDGNFTLEPQPVVRTKCETTTWARCNEPAIAIAHWKGPCKCEGTTAYCAKHRNHRIVNKEATCADCGKKLILDHMEPWTPYRQARATYLKTNLLADKDAMVAAVTLNDPPEWDTFGSLLPAESPKPARLSPSARETIGGLALMMMLLLFGYMLGAVIGI